MDNSIDIGKRESGTTSAGLKKFITYANLVIDNEKPVQTIEELPEAFLCKIETWMGFAGFLKGFAVRGAITKNTAEVYLNAAKDASRSLFSQHPIFIDNPNNKQWQATLIKRMMDAIKVACIEGGIRFEKPKTAPIGSESLKKVSEVLLKSNTLQATLNWVFLVTSSEFCGRSNELTVQDFKFAGWNHVYDVFEMQWVELKTRQQKYMPVVSNVIMENDWFFAMFCYIMLNGGTIITLHCYHDTLTLGVLI